MIYMLGCEIFEVFFLSCKFGMFLFTSRIYKKDCSVLRAMMNNILIVWCFWIQFCHKRCDYL